MLVSKQNSTPKLFLEKPTKERELFCFCLFGLFVFFVCLFVCLFVCFFVCSFVRSSFVRSFVCLFAFLFVFLFVSLLLVLFFVDVFCLSGNLFVFFFLSLSVCFVFFVTDTTEILYSMKEHNETSVFFNVFCFALTKPAATKLVVYNTQSLFKEWWRGG